MELVRIVWRDYRWPFVAVVALSLVSAGLGIGVLFRSMLRVACYQYASACRALNS